MTAGTTPATWGRFDAEGNLFYVARKPEKELIKPGGENVYPAEVEAAILSLDGVAACCVFGVPDATWGEAVVAAVEPRTGRVLEPQEVIDWVASRIARYKKPKHVWLVERLPRKADGTVDREAVKKQSADGSLQSGPL